MLYNSLNPVFCEQY
jgi:hypothetical protein